MPANFRTLPQAAPADNSVTKPSYLGYGRVAYALLISATGVLTSSVYAASLGETITNGVTVSRSNPETDKKKTKTSAKKDAPQQLTWETGLSDWPQTPAGKAATFVAGEKITGHPNREVLIEGKAELRKQGTLIQADTLRYDQDTDEAKAQGNVYLNRGGVSFTGPEAHMQVEAAEGTMAQPSYSVPKTGGNGKAESIAFQSKDEMTLKQGTYSTCSPNNLDWYLKASRLELDNDRKVGVGYGGTLFFYDVPILASPIFSFPLTDSRRSGWLTPVFEQSTAFGVGVTVPYYFNIAPNRDLTLYPRYLTRRGAQLGGDLRYLGDGYSGNLKGEFLPNDLVAKRDRWSYSFTHKQELGKGFNFYTNQNKVSDDSYPDELGRSITSPNLITTRQNIQETGVTYANGGWNGMLRVQRYQTLPVAGVAGTNPYFREPQLSLKYSNLNLNGFEFTQEFDATRFALPAGDNRVTSDRIFSLSQISYPVQAPGYFFTPKVSLHASSYALSAEPTGYTTKNFNRVLPTVSLDGGLVFERDATELSRWFGRSMIQTLEPRLFYAYTPYSYQSMLPEFDTAKMDLSFASIYSPNPYSGNDRIADANSLTAGVTTRFLDTATMKERLRFTLAQRYYFSDQRVLGEQNVKDGVTVGAPSSYRYSDILMAGSSQLFQDIYVTGGLQYTTYNNTVFSSNAGINWRPEPHKVLNATWRYRASQYDADPNALTQMDISGQWPLTSRLYGIGRFNYDYRTKQAIDVLAGLEYDADCWAARLVLHRYANAGVGNSTTTQALVQLDLKGLSNFGTDALGILKLSIPGYQPVSTPPANAQP